MGHGSLVGHRTFFGWAMGTYSEIVAAKQMGDMVKHIELNGSFFRPLKDDVNNFIPIKSLSSHLIAALLNENEIIWFYFLNTKNMIWKN